MAREFLIRRAAPDDADAIREVLQQAFAPYRASYTADAYTDTTLTSETVRERLASMAVLVAADNAGQVIGTIAYQAVAGGEAHVRGMAVRPEWHGSGVAKELLAQVEREVRELHCTAITLDTTRPLERAVRFYETHGFRATGEVSSFFGMDLFTYRKEIVIL